jgi:hypothetical protein
MKNYKEGTVLTVYRNSDVNKTPFEVKVDTNYVGKEGFSFGPEFRFKEYFLKNHTIIGEVNPKLYTVVDLERAFEAGKSSSLPVYSLSPKPVYENFEDYLETLK